MILSDVNNDQTAEFGQESPKTQLLSDVTKETRVSFDEFKKMGHTAPEYESDAFDRLYGGIDNQLRQMMTVGNQLKVFGGQVQMSLGDMFGSDNLIERGRSNIQTASRNLDKQLADIDLAKFPVSQKDQESFVYGLGSGIANYGVMLVGGYGSGALLKAVGAGAKAVSAITSAVGIGSMAALEVGGETQEGLDIYKQRTGDTELKNITPEWAKKEAATTALYGVASGIIEKKFGFGAQRKMFKSPLTFIKGASKTALSEGATESLQELTNAGIDLADGSITWEQLPERIRGAIMEGAIGAVIGGSAGVSVAYAQRANGVKYIKEQIKNTVPVKDQDVVAKSIYDDGVKTLSDVISRELELSSEMQAQHGLVWDNMNKAVKSAIDDSIAQGNEFFSRKSEDAIAEYVTSTSKLFADQVLAEANKRGMLIQDVLDGAKIEYADGKIYLKGKNFTTETAQTTNLNQDMFFQESLDISKQNEELDAKYPAYDGETIAINGQDKTVYNSSGKRIAKSAEALQNFYNWFGDSKVVDEQGRPLVVYHNTDKDIKAFDINKARATMDIQGIFFAPNSDPYKEYGPIEYPVYLKIENPVDYAQAYEGFDMSVEGAGIRQREKLQSQGYDGAILTEDGVPYEYIAFEPNRIKSTSNRGTYSESENIYYQTAFAGSRVDYDRPSLEAIGSGEGAQAHGWGLYYALNRDVAESYRKAFYDEISHNVAEKVKELGKNGAIEFYKQEAQKAEQRAKIFENEVPVLAQKAYEDVKAYNQMAEMAKTEGKGQVHEVDIPENPYLLDEDLYFRHQSEFVQSKIKELVEKEGLTDKFEIYQSKENPRYNILENSSGKEIYEIISEALGSDKDASLLLEKYGIKGITYMGRQDGRCFVIFNPDDVKVIQKFYQGSSRASRGEYNVSEQAIKIAETADFSTLPHELAHFWLDNQFKYIQSGLASQEYIDGFNPIKRYLGISDNQTVIKRYQQEKFARAYEKYLRTKELPDPMLKPGFDKYNKWLRMVYRDANKIRYRNEDGKLVTPKLTEDAVRFFRSMTTGYLEPPVNVVPTRSEAIKQEDAKQKAEGERYMVREIERPTPIVEQTSIKTDRFGKGTSRVYERETGQTLEYNKINLKDQEQRANELVKTDLNKARRIALGFEKADDLTQTAVNIAYRNEMKAIGNINEYAKALEYGSIAQTMRGQEISAERIGIKSPDTVEFWYDKAQYAKTQKVADKVYKSVDKEVFDNKVEALNALMKKKAKELADKLKTAEDKQKVIEDFQKSLQEEFDILYQEDFEDLDDKNIDTWAQRFVEKNFNVLPTEQEIEVINSKIDNLRELAESLEDANGNPSLEALRAYDQMNKYIESLNPSNNLAVFTSVVARGSMLASVKSPILNIVSNAETLLSEGITNRITTLLSGGSLENVVDSKLKSDYLKYGANAYRVSGFNISTAQDLNFERLVTGEKIITTQGEGAFKKFAQKIETGVFKYAMGFPDSISKDIAFVDRVSLECSNVARKEGLKGEALKNRANELFKDAIRIEPMTEEGEVIRKHGISYAHKATFTDDNALSQGALAIRDALNKLSGDLRAGDNLMPFVKTPASVINIGLEYTAGVVYMMPKLDVILRDVKRGEISDVSRQAINSGVRNGLGLLLAYMIAGALDDDDYIPAYEDLGYGDTLLLKEKNVVYNSIKIGDKYVSLDYLGPIGVPVAGILGAKRSNGFGAFSGNVLSQFLRLPGVKDFADTVSGLSKMTKQTSEKNLDMLQQEAIDFISARTVPALVSDIAKAIDSYERDMSNDVWDRLKGKIPVLREELPKVYSKTTGRAVESNGLLTLFVGSRVKEAQSNKIIREVEDIKSQGESVSLSDPTKYGDLRLLDKDDKIDIRKRFAEEYAERVLRTIELPSFKNSSVERKSKMLNNARRHTVSKIKIDYRNKLLEKKRSR